MTKFWGVFHWQNDTSQYFSPSDLHSFGPCAATGRRLYNHHFSWGKASPWWFSIWWKSQCFINFAGLVSSPMFDGLYDVSFPCLTWNHMIFHQASNGHPSVRAIKRRSASRCAKKTNGKEAATQSLGLSGFQDSMGIFDGNIIGIQLGISWKYRVNSWWDKVGFQLSMECWVV